MMAVGEYHYVFKRTEQKYILTPGQYKELRSRLKGYARDDEYGLSTICNVYYDTENFDLIRRSLDKPRYKEKLRLRSYGTPGGADPVFIEIKKKYDGVVYKRRVSMPYEEACGYLNNGLALHEKNQIMKEIDYFLSYYKPVPAVFLAYDRLACFGADDREVRITFDSNIRSRDCDLDLGAGDYGVPLMPNRWLMEIKIPGAMPLWLVQILSEMKVYPSSFSKYGNVYMSRRIPQISVSA